MGCTMPVHSLASGVTPSLKSSCGLHCGGNGNDEGAFAYLLGCRIVSPAPIHRRSAIDVDAEIVHCTLHELPFTSCVLIEVLEYVPGGPSSRHGRFKVLNSPA